MLRTLACALLWCAIGSGTLSAQEKAPKRPRLGGADTNDARAYYAHGVQVIEVNPSEAARAFYWASRIDPGLAQAFYARRVAGFMANEGLMVRYFEGERSVYSSKETLLLDSLESRAQMLNPLFPRDLERAFIGAQLFALINQDRRRVGEPPLNVGERVEMAHHMELYLRTDAPTRLRAALAASDRNFPEAHNLYRRALRESRDKIGVLVDRARVFFMAGMEDSALAGLGQVLDSLRRKDADRVVRVYQSKEFFEHSIGVIYERQGNIAGARDAYGKALQENLAYYPAHVRLGLVSLAAGDTATALAELELATQVATKEPTACVTYAVLLSQTGRYAEAETQARQAIALEPYYAHPHFVLGQIGELVKNRDLAAKAYRDFLARASQYDARRQEVEQRFAELGQD